IIDGIPVHLRDIQAFIDRPEFTRNPTSCEPMSTASTILGSGLDFASEADDQPVVVSSPFQVLNCAALPFAPKLKLAFLSQPHRLGHPAFRATLTMKPGEADIAHAQVTLPPSEILDNAHINLPCTRVQFEAHACPQGSVLGHAQAVTPLLEAPVEGPV